MLVLQKGNGGPIPATPPYQTLEVQRELLRQRQTSLLALDRGERHQG